MMFRYADPWAFWLLSVIPLWFAWWVVARRRQAGVMLPAFGRVRAASGSVPSWRQWIGSVPPLARAGALALLVIALARPQHLVPHSETSKDAIALQLVVDRSGSMTEPVVFEGERMDRLSAVKRIVRRFVTGDGQLYQGRSGDLLGLIAFGTYADTLAPLTTSHAAMLDALTRLEVPQDRRERATAIGDALVLAIARMRAAEDAMRHDVEDPDFEFRSKAIVVLTDGENNAGVYSPGDAAGLAADWGIRVYIVGLREQNDGGLMANFRRGVMQQHEREMQAVAEHTGGRFWAVDDVSQLAEVYAQIDELERTEIRITETTEIVELYHRFVVLAALLLVIEVLLRGASAWRWA